MGGLTLHLGVNAYGYCSQIMNIRMGDGSVLAARGAPTHNPELMAA